MTPLQVQVFSLVISLPGADYRTVGSLLQRHPSAIGAVAYSLVQRRLLTLSVDGRMYPDAQVLA